MADRSSRRQYFICSFCSVKCNPAHVRIMARCFDGTWKCLYRTCLPCGINELQRLNTSDQSEWAGVELYEMREVG